MSELAANLEAVSERIYGAARRAGRDMAEITLVGVSKTQSLEMVVKAYQAGLRHFGENRAEEGQEKAQGLSEWLGRQEVTQENPHWHFIGHIQSRQVGTILEGDFALIHSVDSQKLAERFERLIKRDNYPPAEILLQCNVSGEASKSGFELSQWRTQTEQLESFLEAVDRIAQLGHLTIRGLMTMAPFVDNPEETRPTFQSLAALSRKLQQERPDLDWQHLSMGMTDDFEVAIEEGATLLRVGRAIFGERN